MLMGRRTRTPHEDGKATTATLLVPQTKKGLAYLSCKLFRSSSTTIINTLHDANNSFGLLTFTCKRHIF